tara:strand:+ start:217 stop:759 length:543 start_codon:yes stop_codon:yes gene_type:complete
MEINQENITFSRLNHDSTTQPFFLPNVDANTNTNQNISIIEDNNLLLAIEFKELNLIKAITDFYLDNEAFNKEMYIENWTFFSITKILELVKYYIENNINNIVDLGFMYHGMGHVKVVYYDKISKKIYFRMDGGSNDYDRMANFNELKKISNNETLELDADTIDFTYFINNISEFDTSYL